MKEFLDKYIFIIVETESGTMRHKCALVTDISDTHISLFDTFDDKPYLYRIIDIIEIKLSNRNPEEVENDY
jgi:hypothetical protein